MPRAAIVTGAARGIGLEITQRLLEEGYFVVANSRRITSARSLKSTPQLQLIDGDIALRETAQRIVEAAVHNFGRVDLLVSNAGVFIPKPFTSYTLQDFEAAMQTNVFGFLHLSQLAMDHMRTQKAGHVVTITSSLADQPIAGVPAALTNLTKGGLESVTRAWQLISHRRGSAAMPFHRAP